MATEVVGVSNRCKECGAATEVNLLSDDLDDSGNPRRRAWAEYVPHSRAECDRMTALEREQWPVLPFEGV